MSNFSFNTVDPGLFGGMAQSLGTAPSASSNQAAYDQIVDPDKANYQNPGAQGALTGYQGMADGTNPMLAGARAQQQGALGLARGLADGSGPSLSRANMNLGLSQGMSNLSSMSAGMGGGNQGGLGQRNLLNAAAGMQGNVAGQAGVAGAQEQIGGIKAYGALGSDMRAQDANQVSTGLGGMQSAGGDIRSGNMAYDAANQRTGLARSGAISGAGASAAAGGSKLFDTATNVAAAGATGGASALLSGGGSDPRAADPSYSGAYSDPALAGLSGRRY
jgi:hypothetical protein